MDIRTRIILIFNQLKMIKDLIIEDLNKKYSLVLDYTHSRIVDSNNDDFEYALEQGEYQRMLFDDIHELENYLSDYQSRIINYYEE